ncbi:peptidoglycan-binding protein [Jatrophihabitans endophyticus]|uniref:peptidoglycan-binding protein n=1 Tax=Jatrophihabitans endophyticus TaxID=1206085 RepID=UPI0019F8E57A|nr:peptidoglycan-binding protein [Jatrophihabitans endophyticus]MBE7189376.1 transglycosylase family protein [Jatrophihabitans endophyticus]
MGLPHRVRGNARQTDDDASFFGGWAARNAAARPYTGPDAREQRHRGRIAVAALLCAGAVTSVVLPSSSALADPSPHTWYRLRMCESSDDYRTNTGNGHYGAYQFDVSTWRSVGGHGLPSNASPAEQDARALILYRERGWQPWQCAGILGLRDDSDAGTGRIGDIHVPTSGRGSSHGVPYFPGGTHQYYVGENSAAIRTFQNEMHKRGYFPAGTGQYGPLTLTMVKQLQRLNGLPARGYIGPKTWRLAWKGRYTAPRTTTSSHPSKPHRTSHSTHAVPAFPGGSHQYFYGENNAAIRTFQNQMHKRGYFPAGTGEYGPKTLAMVKQLQRLNGLPARGYIGPKTWKLAWTGKYHHA